MKKTLSTLALGLSPMIAFAQYSPNQGIGGLFALAKSFLGMAVPLIISLAVVWFIFNVFKYAVAGNEDDKAKAKTQMIWGIVGIFVMVSVWGLVAILQSTFGTSGVQAVPPSLLP